MSYFNSKLLYLEVSLKKNIDRAFAHTIHRRCLLHREILKNRLALARVNPNEAVQLIKGRGLATKIAGEVNRFKTGCAIKPSE